jgi:hypothetical protein
MVLKITATDVKELAPGVWAMTLPPHEVRMFGSCPNATGERSIIMLKQSTFDQRAATLSFAMDAVVPLNVGTTPETIALAARAVPEKVVASGSNSMSHVGPGDREFLALCDEKFGPEMVSAARRLLEGIRARTPGDLKRGLSMNFSETPDNFWYVIVQPRVQQLSITVRGTVEHFASIASLPIKDDRGNTLFKVTKAADVPAALDIIFHAKRKERA